MSRGRTDQSRMVREPSISPIVLKKRTDVENDRRPDHDNYRDHYARDQREGSSSSSSGRPNMTQSEMLDMRRFEHNRGEVQALGRERSRSRERDRDHERHRHDEERDRHTSYRAAGAAPYYDQVQDCRVHVQEEQDGDEINNADHESANGQREHREF